MVSRLWTTIQEIAPRARSAGRRPAAARRNTRYRPCIEGLDARVLLSATDPTGIQKIQHVIIIMQENRSFDNYFGTFPGADGIPMQNGVPTVSVYDPRTHRYILPYHDVYDQDIDGPHKHPNAIGDINGGLMNGFIAQAESIPPTLQYLPGQNVDQVMGYHTSAEIPNYWTYAQDFVLQDHMFAPVLSWSLPTHQYLVSGWSGSIEPPFYWTDLTYLMYKNNVSWGY